LVLAPAGVVDPAELGRTIAAQGVTRLWLTSGLFHQMVDAELASLAGVRQILAGGDVVSPAHVRRVLEELPGLRMTACYGPTENTLFTTTCTLRSPAELPATVPLGRPIADGRVYVLDRTRRPVALGVVGEIWAAGDGLARGYFGRPGATAAAFRPDPFGAEGERMYRTGDLGRWRPDGRLEFAGRVDGQLKVRGYRVEPGEIEAALAAHPRVGVAVVVALGEAAADRRLAAFVTAAGGVEETGAGGGPLAAELTADLRRRLPPYMVPGSVVVVAALPRTAHDKIDRRALAALAAEPAAGGAGYVAPRTEIEQVLARLWSELVGVGRIGVHDDFFDLGGHSLDATRHMFRLRELLAVELPVRALYEAPTIEALARRVEEELVAELEAMTDAEVEGLV